MLHSILVPLDGSRLSEKAIPYATSLAQAARADLIFIRAVLTLRVAPGMVTFDDRVKEQARNYLDGKVADATRMGLHAEGIVSEDEPGYAIQQIVATRRPDLMVISTHGRSGLARVVWGSVADYVLHHVSVPTFLIGQNVEPGWTAGKRPVFLVPLDGSALSFEALPIAEELAVAFHGEIALVEAIDSDTWLLSAVDPWGGYALTEPMVSGLETAETDAARHHLSTVAARLTAKGIPTTFLVQEGAAASVIRQAIKTYQAGAVVMATHGRDGATRLLLGSVTDAMVRTARVPVVVVRPQGILPPSPARRELTTDPEQTLLIPMTAPEVALTRTALQQLAQGGRDQPDQNLQAQDLLEKLDRLQMKGQSDLEASAAGMAH